VILLDSSGRHGGALSVSEFAVPRLCDLDRPSAVLSAAEWAIACEIDGLATLREVAGRSGIALDDAMERVTRLVQAGLCTMPAVAPAGLGDRQPSTAAASPLPRRLRETGRAAPAPPVRLDTGLLQQILDGLNGLK
jgi:hypothetical protein